MAYMACRLQRRCKYLYTRVPHSHHFATSTHNEHSPESILKNSCFRFRMRRFPWNALLWRMTWRNNYTWYHSFCLINMHDFVVGVVCRSVCANSIRIYYSAKLYPLWCCCHAMYNNPQTAVYPIALGSGQRFLYRLGSGSGLLLVLVLRCNAIVHIYCSALCPHCCFSLAVYIMLSSHTRLDLRSLHK